jgi:FkbM family methyltransferase
MNKASYDNFTYYTDDEIFIWHINNGQSEPYLRELDIVKFYLECRPSNNNTFIDVGAHIGTISLPYSRLYKHVLAFEPNAQSYDLFVKNIKENSVTNITPFNKGVFNKTMNCKVVRHGETGFLVPFGDWEGLEKYAHLLVNDRLLRETMGSKGRSRIIEGFSLSQMVSSLESIYAKHVDAKSH